VVLERAGEELANRLLEDRLKAAAEGILWNRISRRKRFQNHLLIEPARYRFDFEQICDHRF
jgi:hypothetical protein